MPIDITVTYGVEDGEQADVEPEIPPGEVPLGDDGDDERLHGAEHALRHRDEHLVGVLLEEPALQDDPQRPRHVGEHHKERALDPCRPAAAAAADTCWTGGGGGGEGAVAVHGAQRWPDIESDGEDSGEAQRHAGELG